MKTVSAVSGEMNTEKEHKKAHFPFLQFTIQKKERFLQLKNSALVFAEGEKRPGQ